MAIEVAEEYDISTSTLSNLVWSESRWNPSATSTTGDVGLVQINLEQTPTVSMEQALDPLFSLKYAAQQIRDGKEYAWVACNCVFFIRAMGIPLPPLKSIADLKPNTTPHVGAVVIQKFKSVWHLAYIDALSKDGKSFHIRQSNKVHCLINEEWVPLNSPSIRGFWQPSDSS